MGAGVTNSSHFIYFKEVWMKTGVDKQQSFYLFLENLDARTGRTTVAILSILSWDGWTKAAILCI